MANPQPSGASAPLTNDLLIDLITTGYRWSLGSDRAIDWSLSGGLNGEYWIDPAAVANHIKVIFDVISYYTDVTFNYVGSFTSPTTANSAGSEINITMDGANRFFTANNQWGMGFFPTTQSDKAYAGQAGDVYLNLNSPANSGISYAPGSSGWTFLLHEIGHVLGLKHTHDNGGTGRPTLEQFDLGALDTDWVSVMTYNDGYNYNSLAWNPATPMLLDVLALQYLYGRNPHTNAGDTVHELKQFNAYLTEWDAGGADEISAANEQAGWHIYLPDDQLSRLNDVRVGFAAPLSEMDLQTPKTFLWFTGDIENARGSAYSDEIIGSVLNNRLFGGGGDDYVVGWDGDDYVRGDEGDDELEGGSGFDDINGNMGNDTASGGLGGDWVVGGKDNDKLNGDEGDDIVYGNLGADWCDGGVGNDIVRGGQDNDVLFGQGGNDWLSGDRGDDTMTGGSGADIFHSFGDAGLDRVTDFNRAEGDRVLLDPGTTYTVSQSGADVLIEMGGGGRVVLVGVSTSSLTGDWIGVG